MRITVKVGDIKIVVDEQSNGTNTTYPAHIRYEEQNIQVQKTIKTMAEECLKLLKSK